MIFSFGHGQQHLIQEKMIHVTSSCICEIQLLISYPCSESQYSYPSYPSSRLNQQSRSHSLIHQHIHPFRAMSWSLLLSQRSIIVFPSFIHLRFLQVFRPHLKDPLRHRSLLPLVHPPMILERVRVLLRHRPELALANFLLPLVPFQLCVSHGSPPSPSTLVKYGLSWWAAYLSQEFVVIWAQTRRFGPWKSLEVCATTSRGWDAALSDSVVWERSVFGIGKELFEERAFWGMIMEDFGIEIEGLKKSWLQVVFGWLKLSMARH